MYKVNYCLRYSDLLMYLLLFLFLCPFVYIYIMNYDSRMSLRNVFKFYIYKE